MEEAMNQPNLSSKEEEEAWWELLQAQHEAEELAQEQWLWEISPQEAADQAEQEHLALLEALAAGPGDAQALAGPEVLSYSAPQADLYRVSADLSASAANASEIADFPTDSKPEISMIAP